MNAARDLAATGTPGPWVLCRTQYGMSIEDAADGGQVFIESYGMTYTADPADAAKIAALSRLIGSDGGPLGDLLDELPARLCDDDDCPDCAVLVPLVAAVVAALGGAS